jgi:DNA-binding NarL/FixJ family response regulator
MESPPQVLLMDIGLPGMSGIEGIQPIKFISHSTAIIMLTVYEDNDMIFRSLCAGASGYLLKKSPGAKIVESIREAHEGGAPMNTQIARKVLDIFAITARHTATTRSRCVKRIFCTLWLMASPRR